MSQNLEERQLWALRHTAEHVLHTAMQNLYPRLKKAMGPATKEGFYFDFDLDQKVSEEDFPKIEKEMQRLIDADLPLVQKFLAPEEAKKIFKNNPYKLEWIDLAQKRGEKISLYQMGDEDLDVCRGPHLKSTGEIKAFKLLSVAGAYWRGSEKNKMLTRIYGTCFPTQKELDEYLPGLTEANKRDHRKIGKDLNLFVFSDLIGRGLPMLTQKGTVIRRELEKLAIEEESKHGYQHVITPPLARTELYKTSGHYPYYKDTMYPVMKIDEEELILRPMTCPHHFMLYKSSQHSYRELPVRFAELSPQFRYEKSGELSGLTRVRTFCLADVHIICKKNQAEGEIGNALNLIESLNETLGFVKGKEYRYRLSLGDRNDEKKYYKDDKAWDEAENILRKVLADRKAPYFEAPNEAAFYGPKIDIQMKRVSGQEETVLTVQYDFVMPKRFFLRYTDKDGKDAQPVVIHHSSVGALERTMAFLIEHYAGAFPPWLSPVQTKIIPVTDRQLKYGRKVLNSLLGERIRAELDERQETVSAKIRDAELEKIPYMLVVGDKEAKKDRVRVRVRGKKDLGQMTLDRFLKLIREDIAKKRQV